MARRARDVVTPDMFRADGRETSAVAAASIAPRKSTIRAVVEAFASNVGRYGFTDDELKRAYPKAPESSYRKRRSELSDENIILDSGRQRLNVHRELETVWVHREHFAGEAPAIKPPKPRRADIVAENEALRAANAELRRQVERLSA